MVEREFFNPIHEKSSGRFGVKPGGAAIPVAKGATLDEVVQNMGANELESGQDAHPERYMKHPKSGFMVEKPGVVYPEAMPPKPDGLQPPRVRDVVNGEGFGLPPGYTQADIDSGKLKPLGYGKFQVGPERPPDHLFRAVSEQDWQGIQARGEMKTDGRMNLGANEGTVTSLTNPSYYLPGNLGSDKPGVYQGRILRIKYQDSDGWRHDRDDYVKTDKAIPLSHIDMVSPLLQGTRGDYGTDLQPVKAMADVRVRSFFNPNHDPHSGRFAPGTTGGGAGGVAKGPTAQRILGDAKDTQSLYLDANGNYTPERRQLHQEIVAEALAGGVAQEHPEATFLAGGPGSGKTTVAQAVLKPDPAVVSVNADDLMGKLPEYQEMLKAHDPYAARAGHEEASDLAHQVMNEATARRYSMIVDGTGNSSAGKFQSKIDEAKQVGYKTRVVMVGTRLQTALDRADIRATQTGRLVPHPIIRESRANVVRNFSTWSKAKTVDKWEVWDNDGAPGQQKLVASGGGGKTSMVRDAGLLRELTT